MPSKGYSLTGELTVFVTPSGEIELWQQNVCAIKLDAKQTSNLTNVLSLVAIERVSARHTDGEKNDG